MAKKQSKVDRSIPKEERDYKDWNIDDIIEWCQENDEVAWLKKTAAKETEYKVYPRGENKKADKTQKPRIETRPISFVQLKFEFLEKFMGYKKKEKKQTMFDRINAL